MRLRLAFLSSQHLAHISTYWDDILPLALLLTWLVTAIGLGRYARWRGRNEAWGLVALVPFLGLLLGYALLTILPPGTQLDTVSSEGKRIKSPALWGLLLLGPWAICLSLIALWWVEGSKKMHSPQGEAKVGLGGLFTAATSFHEENKTYVISDIKQLGYTPRIYGGDVIVEYSFWYAVNGIPTRIPLPSGSHYSPGPCDLMTPPTSVEVATSAHGFTAAAKGNIDSDATCDEWSINDVRDLKLTLDDRRN